VTVAFVAGLAVFSAAMSRAPSKTPAETENLPGGAACELPPDIEISGAASGGLNAGLLPLDRQTSENQETATFALG
jgi:hypothetical protein